MKLFGKNDAADGEETPEAVDGMEDTEGAGIADGDTAAPAGAEEADAGGALSAPARSLTAAGMAGKKKLLLLAGVLGLAGLGAGGYFYMSGDTTPPAPLKPVHAPMAAAPAVVPATPVVPPAAAGSPAQPAPVAAAAPAPGVAPVTAAIAPAPIIPAAGTPATTPAGAPALGSPPADEAQAVPAGQMASVPAGQMASVPAGQMTSGQAAAGQTPPTAVPPATAAGLSAPAITGPAATGPVPATGAAAAPASPSAATPSGPAIAGATVAPGEEPPADLPMPVDMGAPNDAAAIGAATAAVGTGAAATSTPAATAHTAKAGNTGKPSPAEMAIVQNAAVLDQLSQPAKGPARPFDPNQPAPNQADALKTVDQLLEEPAIVRPMPPSWLHVKVEHAAGGIDERLTAAREALAQNNDRAALELFTELEQKYPKDKRLLMGKAVALQKLGQYDDALAAYEAVLNNDPKNLEALTNMLGLLKARDPKLALSKLVELRETYPYQADITTQLGISYAAMGQYDDALKYLDMAEALNPSSAFVLYNKAVLYDKMGRTDQARDLYRQILREASEGSLYETLPLESIKSRLSVLH